MTDTATRCPTDEALERYVTFADCDRAAIERHAAGCASCREALLALGLALGPATPEEEAAVSSVLAATRPPLPGGFGGAEVVAIFARRPAQILAAAAAVAAAVLLGPWIADRIRAGTTDPVLLASLVYQGDQRPIEARPALDVAHAPFRPTRGTSANAEAERALGELLLLKAEDPAAAARPLALFYASRGEAGDRERAAAELARAPESPERWNDEGMQLLAAGDAAAALARLDRAVSARPDLLPALFNRSLALELLARDQEAIEAWERYLAVAADRDAGWTDEARARLEHLRSRARRP